MHLVETSSATPVHISDLGLYVSSQAPVYITSAQLKESLVLSELRRLGAVRVSKGSPSRAERAAPPAPIASTRGVAFQAPAPKGVRNPPAPAQRPARVAPPTSPPAKKDAPQSSRRASADAGTKASKTSQELRESPDGDGKR